MGGYCGHQQFFQHQRVQSSVKTRCHATEYFNPLRTEYRISLHVLTQAMSDSASNVNGEGNDDDDQPQLSEHALSALQEFYAERLAQEESGRGTSSAMIEENWVSVETIIIPIILSPEGTIWQAATYC